LHHIIIYELIDSFTGFSLFPLLSVVVSVFPSVFGCYPRLSEESNYASIHPSKVDVSVNYDKQQMRNNIVKGQSKINVVFTLPRNPGDLISIT
jgi:hypothetical protein